MWVPLTMEGRVLGFRMEEPAPDIGVAANILNKLPRTADKRWSSSTVFG